jgi:hypothetical protein
MVISHQVGYFAVGLAFQRVIFAEMNPAVDWPDSINPALPALVQEFTGISTGFIEPESPVLCQKAADRFDLRTGDTWFAPHDGLTAALGIAPVSPSAFHSGPGFNVCQSAPEDFQGHFSFSLPRALPNGVNNRRRISIRVLVNLLLITDFGLNQLAGRMPLVICA